MGIELILPFLGSVFVTWLLRRLDKSNINLKKIKGILESGEKRLHNIVLEKTENLKDATTDFDILQINTLKQLESFRNEFAKAQHSLSEIEAKNANLGRVEKELNQLDMTTRAVQGQIAFIADSLNKIDFQHKRIKKIEERVATVDAETARMVKTFQEILAKKSKELAQSMESKVKDIFIKSDHYEKELKEELQSRQQEMNQEVQREYEALKGSLKKDGQALSSDLGHRFNQGLKVSEELEDKIERIQENIDHSIPEFLQELKEKTTIQFAENEEKAESLMNNIKRAEEKFSKSIQAFQDNIQHHKQEISQNFMQEVDHLKDQVRKLDFETISKKDEIVKAARQEAGKIEEHIEKFRELFITSRESYLTEAGSKKDEVVKAIQKEAEQIEEYTKKFQELHIKAQEDYLAKVRSEKTNLENSITQMYEEYKSESQKNMREVTQQAQVYFC